MKKYFFIVILMLPVLLFAQGKKDYRVVFDLTSKDTLVHKVVIKWVNEVIKAEPDAQVEVVMFAQGLSMVTNDKSTVANDIAKFASNKNVQFKVCEVAMKNQKLVRDQLLPQVTLVPDGIYEIISKQRQGWGYIKASL